jgi:hypothetical protein
MSPAQVGGLAPKWLLNTAWAVAVTPTVDRVTAYVPGFGGSCGRLLPPAPEGQDSAVKLRLSGALAINHCRTLHTG